MPNLRVRKRTVLAVLAVLLTLHLTSRLIEYAIRDPLVLNDVSGLNKTRVSEVLHSHAVEDLREAVLRANETGLKVSISGSKHSQGGHAFYNGSIHLDMKQFDDVLSLDVEAKRIRVQSGITWGDIQAYVNPYGLAVKVIQSSNVFTVGGSLSANCHGRDPRYGPVIETVKSFRLLQADGQIINVSRDENAVLFGLVIGGFGLFGVILDVELELADDKVYEKQTELMDISEYAEYFKSKVKGNRDVELHFGRLSIAPDSLLSEAYAVSYLTSDENPEGVSELLEETDVRRNRFFFGLSRKWNWGKQLRWNAQKSFIDDPSSVEIISRNNSMNPPIQFLKYDPNRDTDILQEYFIPLDQFSSFVDALRTIVEEENINLLSVTVRYIPENDEAFLSYAANECFAIVLYINQKLSKKGRASAEAWTQRLVDITYEHNGTYFLIYQRYPTQEQLRKIYPKFDSFLELKRIHDPEELFSNGFYEFYGQSKKRTEESTQ